MDFFLDLPWQCWALPALLVVAWTALWWGSRRARLWFAGLTPPGAVVIILLGLIEMLSPGPQQDEPADLSGRISALGSGPGTLIVAVGLLALVVGTALTIVTFVVETTLMVRRHERAQRDAAAQPPS
ncbi:hypothetical protein DMB66_39850 [Actinoplanes sp. ATCC 53533]|uniref:hypothetical protein n=1 Tax=Actinoplanes sp. ATCC 53533 TaxID=1288362 RepID=UPI000F785111|nr:hypothetical protein [Actinoplanes sp. ATCC 53533]RSM52616.1 hypothetical protein DMB66_39850 [Actinoplanes sp. ATCC 53533]